MSASKLPVTSAGQFDWPLCHDAERLIGEHVEAFLLQNSFARRLAERMRDETGNDFFEWVDHLVLDSEQGAALRAAGFVEEVVEALSGMIVLWHPQAMMPRVLLQKGVGKKSAPAVLAIRPEVVADFLAAHDLAAPIEGQFGARLRRAIISEENGTRLEAVERLGHRGYVVREPTADFVRGVLRARELWQTRRRDFADDADGVKHAEARLDAVLAEVDRDAACELFFSEERRFWESRNRAGQIQKRRQDRLGLGWGQPRPSHLPQFPSSFCGPHGLSPQRLGFQKRERYLRGRGGGSGARRFQEQPATGIVHCLRTSTSCRRKPRLRDFSSRSACCRPRRARLGTVGLWFGLHGELFLHAGMHHLEARFDFLR